MYAAIIVVFFSLRFYLAFLLIPSPVGDSVVFLEPIYNYCHSNSLVAHLFPIDPLGKDRFVWHGPLPAMLYHLIAPGCTLRTVFVLRTLAFLAIPLSLLTLVWRGLLPGTIFFVVTLFCLAFYEKHQFRPDSFSMIFIVLAYCSMAMKWPIFEGCFAAGAFMCAPVSGALYAVIRVLLTRFPGPKSIALALAGALAVVLVVLLVYPFPVKDLLDGLQANARIVGGRSEGSLFTYYVRSDFLPLWGLSIVTLVIAVSLKKPAFLLTLPFIWYFGIRVPPTNYNLIPVAVGTMLLGYPLMSQFWRSAAMVSLLVPAALGLAQISARDIFSIFAYPDSFARSQMVMANIIAHGPRIVAAPEFAVFTNPSLEAVAGKDPRRSAELGSNHGLAVIVADNGSQGKCPDGTILSALDQQSPRLLIFRSSSSWAVRVCYAE
ncbi:MAG: hypothetical protein ACLPKB_31950 [Xanthobacteraceae bacterium]